MTRTRFLHEPAARRSVARSWTARAARLPEDDRRRRRTEESSGWRLEAAGGAGARRESAGASVLVVDDEAAMRLICGTNLRAVGLHVLEAADGEEALRIARREQPDLILLDVMMPGLDGFEVATQLAGDRRTAAIPVAFLSARAEGADIGRGMQLGAVAYFTKPFDPVRLSCDVELLVERLRREGRERVREEARARVEVERGWRG